MLSGVPHIVGIYQPAAVEGQAADDLHAVVLRMDIVRLEPTE